MSVTALDDDLRKSGEEKRRSYRRMRAGICFIHWPIVAAMVIAMGGVLLQRTIPVNTSVFGVLQKRKPRLYGRKG